MKKDINKMIITLVTIIISFFAGVSSTMALNECNIGDKNSSRGYGTVDANYTNPSYSQSAKIYLNCLSQQSDSNVSLTGWSKNSWSETRKFEIIYAAPKNAKVKSFSMVFYNDNGEALCSLTNENWTSDLVGKQYGTFTFNLTSGHVARIVATGKYVQNKETKSFDEKKFFIGKKVGNTGSVSNKTTTKKTKKGETTTTSTRGASNGDAVTGGTIGVADQTKKYIVDEDGNIITGQGTSCTDVSNLIHEYWSYVMVIVPILLIIMITIDFFKALAKGDSESIKKAGNNTVKRSIAAVVLLALPALLGIIFDLVGLDLCV